MLSVLIVGDTAEVEEFSGRDSSIEVLWAHDAEEAVEKLARNRRLDAVLILAASEANRIVEAIRDDNPSPPPIFLAAGSPTIPGARALGAAAENPAMLLELLAQALAG